MRYVVIPGIVKTGLIDSIIRHGDPELGIFKAQEEFEKNNKYLDVEIPAKFLCWLLLDADSSLYTGDIIGIYNQKYQSMWHDSLIPSPFPDNIKPP